MFTDDRIEETKEYEEGYPITALQRRGGKFDSWVGWLELDNGEDAEPFKMPSNVKEQLEDSFIKRKVKFAVTGNLKVISKNLQGCRGEIRFNKRTLRENMRPETLSKVSQNSIDFCHFTSILRSNFYHLLSCAIYHRLRPV